MRRHIHFPRKYDESPSRFDRRGRKDQCSPLIVVAFVIILFATLTQSGCVGLTSAGSPVAKGSSTSTSADTIPSITTGPLPNAQLGIQFQESLTATGGVQPYLWSIATGKLPTGMALNPASGKLSGMASQGGQFDFSAHVSDSSSPTPQIALKALTLSVLAFALQISPGALPSGQVGVLFQTTITGNGGVTPYTWTATGALPSGLTLNASSGTIAGTPKLAGKSTFTLNLMDSTGQTVRNAASITIVAPGKGGGPVLSPSIPVVNQGATLTFTCISNCGTGGTWSASGTDSSGQPTTAAGSIDSSTGVYTAPATVKAQQSYGGYQLLPNNHVFNTRIDSLPVNAGGKTFTIEASRIGANRTRGISTIHYSPSSGLSPGTYVTISGVRDSSFNGTVKILSAGCNYTCFTYSNPGSDTTSGGGTLFVPLVSEIGTGPINYLVALPINYVNGSTFTQSMLFKDSPANNGLFQVPAYPGARVQCGWFSSVLDCDKHLFTINTTDGMFQELYQVAPPGTFTACPTCNADSGARYQNSQYDLPTTKGVITAAGNFMMPLMLKLQEMENAVATGGTINHAISITLSNNFICGSSVANSCSGNAPGTRHIWPATSEAYVGFGATPYGLRLRLKSSFNISSFSPIAQILMRQLKEYGVIITDGGLNFQSNVEQTKWPAAYLNAFNEVTASVAVTDWEPVDESGLEISSTSGEATSNREIVSYTSSTGKATVDVVLQGVTVNVPKDALYIQAGTPTQQLLAYVHGGTNNTVTWSMSPAITGATLSSGGLFTPPSTLGAAVSTTVTATSTDNASVSAMLTLWVFPEGSIQLRPGANSVYTDSGGKNWVNAGGDDGWINCCGNLSTGPWPAMTDIAEYYFQDAPASSTAGDIRFDFTVPNGVYQIRVKLGTGSPSGRILETLEAQGTAYYSGIDVNMAAGGAYRPIDYVLSGVSVTNGELSFVLRVGGGPHVATINALQITRIP